MKRRWTRMDEATLDTAAIFAAGILGLALGGILSISTGDFQSGDFGALVAILVLFALLAAVVVTFGVVTTE